MAPAENDEQAEEEVKTEDEVCEDGEEPEIVSEEEKGTHKDRVVTSVNVSAVWSGLQ